MMLLGFVAFHLTTIKNEHGLSMLPQPRETKERLQAFHREGG